MLFLDRNLLHRDRFGQRPRGEADGDRANVVRLDLWREIRSGDCDGYGEWYRRHCTEAGHRFRPRHDRLDGQFRPSLLRLGRHPDRLRLSWGEHTDRRTAAIGGLYRDTGVPGPVEHHAAVKG